MSRSTSPSTSSISAPAAGLYDWGASPDAPEVSLDRLAAALLPHGSPAQDADAVLDVAGKCDVVARDLRGAPYARIIRGLIARTQRLEEENRRLRLQVEERKYRLLHQRERTRRAREIQQRQAGRTIMYAEAFRKYCEAKITGTGGCEHLQHDGMLELACGCCGAPLGHVGDRPEYFSCATAALNDTECPFCDCPNEDLLIISRQMDELEVADRLSMKERYTALLPVPQAIPLDSEDEESEDEEPPRKYACASDSE